MYGRFLVATKYAMSSFSLSSSNCMSKPKRWEHRTVVPMELVRGLTEIPAWVVKVPCNKRQSKIQQASVRMHIHPTCKMHNTNNKNAIHYTPPPLREIVKLVAWKERWSFSSEANDFYEGIEEHMSACQHGSTLQWP